MTQEEKRHYLINTLLSEQPQNDGMCVPTNEREQRRILRSLFNIRPPLPATDEFLQVQDAYLREEIARKGVTDITSLRPVQSNMYLWQGDITTLRCDAIVNAANSALLGCFCPCHGCIDNAIHTFAGIELRLACAEIMEKQGYEEKSGRAKITSAFNLPCRYVLHTVGPIVRGTVTGRDEKQLASCYRSCLELAEQKKLKSIAFCCISTGEFHFPGDRAAEIAVRTVTEFTKESQSEIKVIFNVFRDTDYEIYKKLLGAD